jgi:hypothetical protein
MNTTRFFCRNLLGGLAISLALVATAFAQEDDVVGTWACGLSIDDPASGASVNADFETTYDSDGTYERDGQLVISIDAMQLDITVAMDEAGNWRVIESTGLGETATEISFSTLSEMPTQMEQMILQQMQTESNAMIGKEEVAEITAMTADAMELTSDDGAALTCNKA